MKEELDSYFFFSQLQQSGLRGINILMQKMLSRIPRV